jgi:hypothetical protein
MNASDRPLLRGGSRRSHQVALVLLGTAGALGVALAWDAGRRATAVGAEPEAPAEPAPPIAADRIYNNNEYIPGVGYYHAPYRAWYPYPYNHHDPARGYFAGGLWQALPWAIALSQSRPSEAAVAAALAARRRDENLNRSSPTTRSFGSSWSRGGWFSSSQHPAAPTSGSHSSIIRGGFGGSAHGASS